VYGIEPPEELEKVAGIRRVSRLVASASKSKKPETVQAGLRAVEKTMRRADRYPGGKKALEKTMGYAGPARSIARSVKTSSAAPESQKVVVSRVPKVRKRQLEALKSRGIETPTKTAGLGYSPGKDRAYLTRHLRPHQMKGLTPKQMRKMVKGDEEEARGFRDLSPDMHKKWLTEYHGTSAKTAMLKEAIGLMPLAIGALVVPHAVGEAKKNLQATQGTGGAVVTPQQIKLRRQQMGTM
jgi:hypothetical protein